MQRFPDNILPDDPYGFSLGLHCKDITNALKVVNQGGVESPMLELAAGLMHEARERYGDGADHTTVTMLPAQRHGVEWREATPK